MKYNFRNVRRFQAGGPMNAGGTSNGDPMQQLIEGAMQAVQSQDGNLALQVCEMLVQLVQGAQGGSSSEETDYTPDNAPEGEPVYRTGGKLIHRVHY